MRHGRSNTSGFNEEVERAMAQVPVPDASHHLPAIGFIRTPIQRFHLCAGSAK
jgi:hypothetical protein